LLEQQLALSIRHRMLPHFARRELSVGLALARELAFARAADPCADSRTRFAFAPPRKFLWRHRRHLDVDVDAEDHVYNDLIERCFIETAHCNTVSNTVYADRSRVGRLHPPCFRLMDDLVQVARYAGASRVGK